LTERRSANQSEAAATMGKGLFAICALLCVAISSTIPRDDGERQYFAKEDDNNNNRADDHGFSLRASDDVVGRKLRQRTTSNMKLVRTHIVFNHGDATPFDYDGFLRHYCPETGSFTWKKEMTEPHPTIPLPLFNFRNLSTGLFLSREPVERKHFLELYDKEKFLPGGARAFGLTRKGMEECYELGKRIRERYKGKLHLSARKRRIEAYTSNFQRTRLCLAYLFSGVFPKNEEPSGKELFYFNLYDGWLAQFFVRNSVTRRNWKRFYRTHAGDFVQGYDQSTKTIASLCQRDQTMEPLPFWLHDGVAKMMVAWKANGLNEDKSQPVNNLTMGILPLLPDLQKQMHKLKLAKYIGDSRFDIDLKNLTAVPLLADVVHSIHGAIRGPSGYPYSQMEFDSGFDVAMIPLMSALGITWESTLPPTASLTFELYRDKSAERPPPTEIPRGYIKGSDGLFYKYHSERKTWNQAHHLCHEEGGNLAIIYNRSTRDVVRHFMENGWIGVTDQYGEMSWKTPLLDEIRYSSWRSDEPSWKGYEYRDCALQNSHKQWITLKCTARRSFICQFRQAIGDDSSDDSSDEEHRGPEGYGINNHCNIQHNFDFVKKTWKECNDSMYHVLIRYTGIEEEDEWSKLFRLSSLDKKLKEMTGQLDFQDPEAGFDGCKNATFTLRGSHQFKDRANAHCYGENCIDVECAGSQKEKNG